MEYFENYYKFFENGLARLNEVMPRVVIAKQREEIEKVTNEIYSEKNLKKNNYFSFQKRLKLKMKKNVCYVKKPLIIKKEELNQEFLVLLWKKLLKKKIGQFL